MHYKDKEKQGTDDPLEGKSSLPERGTSRSRRTFWTLFFSVFCSMLGVGIIVPFLPKYAQLMGADSLFYVGLIFGFMNLSRMIFLPIMRREVESGRRNKKIVLIEGLALYIFLSISYIFADTPFSLGVVRFFNGFAASMVIPISMAIIGELAPVMGEGREMGDFQMALMTGFGLGPLLGGVLGDIAGFEAAFMAMGFLNLVAIILVIIALPGKVFQTTGGPAARPAVLPYRKALSSRIVLGVMVFRCINAVGRGASFTFIPILASSPELALSNTQIGVIITSLAMLAGLLSLVFGRLADRMSRVKLVITGSLGFIACVSFMPHCHSFLSLLLAASLSGVFGALALPASAAISVVEGRRYGMVTIMILFQLAMSAGLFVGPPLGGLVGDFYGLTATFYFAGLVGVFGTAVFYLLLRNTEANNSILEHAAEQKS